MFKVIYWFSSCWLIDILFFLSFDNGSLIEVDVPTISPYLISSNEPLSFLRTKIFELSFNKFLDALLLLKFGSVILLW